MISRVAKSVVAFYACYAITTAGSLLLVPLYLKVWSPTVYGEWLSLFSLVAYLSLLDFGITASVYNRLTQNLAQGKLEEYRALQHSAMFLYLSLAIIGTLALAFMVWLLPLTSWLGLKETPAATAKWVVFLLGLQVMWNIPAGIVSNVYRTTGDLARTQWIGNSYQLLCLGTLALLLFSGFGMRALALGQLAVMAGVYLTVYWQQRRRLPQLVPGIARARLVLMREQLRPGLYFGTIMIASILAMQGPVIIIAAALGGAAVALFVTTRTLVNVIQQAINAFGHALWPELTIMNAVGDKEKLHSALRNLQFFTTVVGTALFAFLWFEGASIIQVWTNHLLTPDVTLLRLLLGVLCLRLLWSPSSHLPAATNRHGKLAASQLISAVIGLTVALCLVGRWGIWAPPLGLLVGEALACSYFVVKDAGSLLGLPYWVYARRIWLGLLSMSALALGIGWVAHNLVSGPLLFHWAVVLASLFLTSLAAGWLLCLKPQDRSLFTVKLKLLFA
jgi:O-antigen/teichoic acid export membrane protein